MASVGHADWRLHRKGTRDQERHKEKIKEALRDNLHELVGRNDIILSNGNDVVRVPIRGLDTYKFRFTDKNKSGVGQGTGKSKVGEVIARSPNGQPGQNTAGESDPGNDYYEAEFTIDEIRDLMFEDLGLPNLREKKRQDLVSEAIRFTDIRKTGVMANLDKRRTILANIKRNALSGDARLKRIRSEDLRFKTWEPTVEHRSSAVIIAMMDVSGSMGDFEKYIARSFYYWMVEFLRTKYTQVEIVFITHTTEAKEVEEHEFFTKGESGGTVASSAYQLALQIIYERYAPDDWNIYPFHFSDGDNALSDYERMLESALSLLQVSNQFGYGEIRGRWKVGYMYERFQREINDPKLVIMKIEDKQDVYPALKKFFASDWHLDVIT